MLNCVPLSGGHIVDDWWAAVNGCPQLAVIGIDNEHLAILFDPTPWASVHAMAISIPGKKGGGGIPPPPSILNQSLRYWQLFIYTCLHFTTVVYTCSQLFTLRSWKPTTLGHSS